MWERFVSIDYEALADYLLSRYNVDLPASCGHFERFRGALQDHLEVIMDLEPNIEDPDPELTELLFKHHVGGEPIAARVTRSPGIVVIREGQGVPLPRVIIELKHMGS